MMPEGDPNIVTLRDTTACGYCVSGTRRWFIAHNLDFEDFKRNGITVEDFLATNDALAQIVVDRKLANG